MTTHLFRDGTDATDGMVDGQFVQFEQEQRVGIRARCARAPRKATVRRVYVVSPPAQQLGLAVASPREGYLLDTISA